MSISTRIDFLGGTGQVSTNLIESAFIVAQTVTGRVKRWRGGDMRLRWRASGLLAVEQKFRKIRGYQMMSKLSAALDGSKESGTNPYRVDQKPAAA